MNVWILKGDDVPEYAVSQAAIADIEFGMLARVSADSQRCTLHGTFPLTRMVPA